jgi:Ca-activated chloride channel family protein
MLLSDGQANHGETNVDRICEQVAQLAKSGISTSTVGIGIGFNEVLMTSIAIAGQGTALYGDRGEDLAEPFDAELGLLSRLAWRDVTLTISSGTQHWTMHNDYAQNADGSWRLPSIAAKSEAWMALSISMLQAVRMQQRSADGSALQIVVRAKDASGTSHSFGGALRELPIVPTEGYRDFADDQLVALRFGEIEAADMQRLARAAVHRGDWAEVDRMLAELRRRAADNPWLLGTLEVMQTLLTQRDRERMEKELQYASYSMKSRLTDLDEVNFLSSHQELEKAAFLRRKVHQGRRSDS